MAISFLMGGATQACNKPALNTSMNGFSFDMLFTFLIHTAHRR